MTVTDRIEQRIEGNPRGIGLLGRIGRGWGARRGPGGAPPAVADPHDCQWRLLAYASLPSTPDAPEASTLMIEGCCLCPTVRSAVLAGRWVPAALGELVRVDGGPAASTCEEGELSRAPRRGERIWESPERSEEGELSRAPRRGERTWGSPERSEVPMPAPAGQGRGHA